MSERSSKGNERLLPHSLFRRSVAFLLDALLETALSVLLVFIAAIPALGAMPGFLSSHETTFSSIERMEEIEVDAGLSLVDANGHVLENKDAYDAFLKREISYSYFVSPSSFGDLGPLAASYPAGGIDGDLLGYFYLRSPLLEGNAGRLDLDGFASFFFSYFPKDDFFLSGDGFPALDFDLALEALSYLEEGGEKPSFYDIHLQAYLSARAESLSLLSTLDAFKEPLEAYERAFAAMAAYEFAAAAVCFLLSYLAVSFFPRLFSSSGMSVGGMFSSLRLRKEDGSTAEMWRKALYGGLSFLTSFFLLFLTVGFSFGFSILTVTLFPPVDYLVVLLVFFALFIIDKIPLLTDEKATVSEIAAGVSLFWAKK